MPEEMTCFACDREPSQQCARCGRLYCDAHGEELCDACLEPASAVPSFTLYRGSLLALLIGTALAVWLLVQPTGSEGEGVRPVVLNPTAAAREGAAPAPGSRSAGTPAASTTPGAGAGEYTVASGDTLSTICEKVKPASMTVGDCVDRVVALNNLANPNDIAVGDNLRVPR